MKFCFLARAHTAGRCEVIKESIFGRRRFSLYATFNASTSLSSSSSKARNRATGYGTPLAIWRPFSQRREASLMKSDGANFALHLCVTSHRCGVCWKGAAVAASLWCGVKKPHQFRSGIVALREILRYAGSSRSVRACAASTL